LTALVSSSCNWQQLRHLKKREKAKKKRGKKTLGVSSCWMTSIWNMFGFSIDNPQRTLTDGRQIPPGKVHRW
jgi:hypothetical protein